MFRRPSRFERARQGHTLEEQARRLTSLAGAASGNSFEPSPGNHAMLGHMADSGRTDDPPTSPEAPPTEDKDVAAETQGGDVGETGRTASGQMTADAIKRPSSVALLADLERRVRKLEAHIDGLEGAGSSSRRLVKAWDMVRWGLWLVVIAFLAFYWLRLGAPR